MEKVNPGPVNIQQAEEYTNIPNGLFEKFMELIKEDKRDALETTVKALEVHMQKTWANMMNAQVDITTLTIVDPSCTTLRESLEPQPVTTSDPDDDLPTGEQVIKTLPQTQNKAVTEDCITCLTTWVQPHIIYQWLWQTCHHWPNRQQQNGIQTYHISLQPPVVTFPSFPSKTI